MGSSAEVIVMVADAAQDLVHLFVVGRGPAPHLAGVP
jgi:hypothetical protein